MPPNPGAVDTSSTEKNAWRKDIEGALKSVEQLVQKSHAPIPKNPYQPTNDPDKVKLTGLFHDLHKVGLDDLKTLLDLFSSEIKGYQDDDKFVLERLVKLLSTLGADSKLSHSLTGGFINNLWAALPHPPLSSLGSKYQYRDADGGNNNIRIPDLGAAGSPYARSAKPQTLQNISLPDPGVIFDSLMDRGDKFEPHPNKISSMLFYLATIIIHDIFRTSHVDFTISDTSSYLDLAPLYGSTQPEQDAVRTFHDGRLKPDTFSEKRILGFPPGVSVFLIMFNRFHNHVVTQLATINENGRFTKPKAGAEKEKELLVKYDNDLFQTGRLITCGLYVNCVLKDYVRTILNLNRSGTKWDLDPRTEEGKTLFNSPAAEGTGNQVSAEFNLIYRWHSAISKKDEEWTEAAFERVLGGKTPSSPFEVVKLLAKWEDSIPSDPGVREFDPRIKRQSDGSFKDEDLVPILESSISDVAGSFGANRVPKIMRSVEILGIIQARSWNLASLNEFRQFAGLTKHTTFEDINPDPAVVEKLKNLYDSPDFVELYPGLVAEKPKPPKSPGSGLCVNFTTSYAILSDAVGLVRGDRFYTVDYTPKNLTNWGYQEVQYDTSVDDGAVLYKLILRAFPNWFRGDSVYAHFPFVIPSENLIILKSLGRADKYSWDKPARIPGLVVVKSYAAAKRILENKMNWKVTWGEAITFLVSQPKRNHGIDYCLAGDNPPNAASRVMVKKGLYPKDWQRETQEFYEQTTAEFLQEYSYRVPGTNTCQVDIVRDVANLVNAKFAASVFSIPLKTDETPRGIYTEQELYQVLSLCYRAIFINIDVSKSFQIREGAHMLAQQLGDLILLNAEAISATGFIADIIAKLHQHTALTDYGTHMIQRMLENKIPVKDAVWSHILPTAASMTANQSQVFSQALDYYLGDGAKYIPELHNLAKANTKEADELILRYFMEGARLRATLALFRDYVPSSGSDGSADLDGIPAVPPGGRVLVALNAVSRDPAAFPNPNEVDLKRPLDSYIHYGWGPHQCAGMDASQVAVTAMFKTVFALKNVKRAQGGGPGGCWYGSSPGELKTLEGPHGLTLYLTADQSTIFPFPTTMKIQWDEE